MKDLAGPCEFPKTWAWTTLGEIAKGLKAGGTPSKKVREFYEGGSLPFVKIEDMVNSKKYLYNTITKITEEGLANSSAWIVPENSLLYSMYASYGIPTINKIEVATNQAIIVFQPPTGLIYLDYVYYFLLSTKPSLKKYLRGTTQPNLNAAIVRSLPVPLAPLPEQHRIVARIEELFSHLDAGVQALQKAKAQLQRYRQSVLQAAVKGKLTEEWRKAHPEVEPAEELLERVRTKKWHDRKTELETSDLPDVPREWVWTILGEIGNVSGGLTKNSKKDNFPLKMPYLRVANVYAGKLRLDEMKEIGLGENELGRVLLNHGDLLVVEGNGSPDQIGRVALWDGSISPCVHQNHIIKVRFNPTCIGRYVLHWLLSMSGREQINKVASSTSGLYTLSISKVASLLVPLPPLLEQEKIVDEIEYRLSIVEEEDKIIDINILRVDRLRQSILQRAFQGKLVPQDPNDEPASQLLGQIRAERIKETPRRGRKSNNNTHQMRLSQ